MHPHQATEGKYEIPDNWQWRGAHDFFRNPDVTPAENIPPLKWGLPDEDGLVKFLCGEWPAGVMGGGGGGGRGVLMHTCTQQSHLLAKPLAGLALPLNPRMQINFISPFPTR